MNDEQVKAVLLRVAQRHYITMERLLGRDKDKFAFAARQTAARELFNMGLNSVQIGRYINRDPSTVCNLLGTVRKAKELRK